MCEVREMRRLSLKWRCPICEAQHRSTKQRTWCMAKHVENIEIGIGNKYPKLADAEKGGEGR